MYLFPRATFVGYAFVRWSFLVLRSAPIMVWSFVPEWLARMGAVHARNYNNRVLLAERAFTIRLYRRIIWKRLMELRSTFGLNDDNQEV